MPDGDLWHIFLEHVLAKGRGSLGFKKVKAHATPEQISEGIISKFDYVANEHADHVADRGVYIHTSAIILLARAYVERDFLVAKFLALIHGQILCVLREENRVREAAAKQQKLIGGQAGQQHVTIRPMLPQPAGVGRKNVHSNPPSSGWMDPVG